MPLKTDERAEQSYNFKTEHRFLTLAYSEPESKGCGFDSRSGTARGFTILKMWFEINICGIKITECRRKRDRRVVECTELGVRTMEGAANCGFVDVGSVGRSQRVENQKSQCFSFGKFFTNNYLLLSTPTGPTIKYKMQFIILVYRSFFIYHFVTCITDCSTVVDRVVASFSLSRIAPTFFSLESDNQHPPKQIQSTAKFKFSTTTTLKPHGDTLPHVFEAKIGLYFFICVLHIYSKIVLVRGMKIRSQIFTSMLMLMDVFVKSNSKRNWRYKWTDTLISTGARSCTTGALFAPHTIKTAATRLLLTSFNFERPCWSTHWTFRI